MALQLLSRANKYILSLLLFIFCSALLILQQVMINGVGVGVDAVICFYVCAEGCSVEHKGS